MSPGTTRNPKSTTMNDTELPKQELLIKLMGMTGSSNDGEALVALRKATDLLNSAGWDWRRLIEGKIKVIEDPFKSVSKPKNPARGEDVTVRNGGSFGFSIRRTTAPQAPPPPQAPWVGQPTWHVQTPEHQYFNPLHRCWQKMPYVAPAAPVDQWGVGGKTVTNAQAPTKHRFGVGKNKYGGPCYCCGTDTPPQMGMWFKPGNHNPSALMKNVVICDVCDADSKTKIPNRAAPSKAGASLQDLF